MPRSGKGGSPRLYLGNNVFDRKTFTGQGPMKVGKNLVADLDFPDDFQGACRPGFVSSIYPGGITLHLEEAGGSAVSP